MVASARPLAVGYSQFMNSDFITTLRTNIADDCGFIRKKQAYTESIGLLVPP